MAYDRARKEEIDSMPVGELIHTMLTEYDPAYKDGGAWMQSQSYFWASERLNEITADLTTLPAGTTQS